MLSLKSLSIAAAFFTLFLDTNASPLIAERWAPSLPTCTNTTDFVYAGCFIDPSYPSALLFRPTDLNSQNMTVEICVDFCKGNGYKYAGLEYYGECFCGASVGGSQTAESNCSFPCTGDQNESCGGNDILSVYQDTTFPTVNSTTISDYTPMGCYSDLGPNGRTLAWKQDQIPNAILTVEACLRACKEGGYPFAGVEYSQECYCGVVLGNGTVKVDESNCQMTCNGDTTEFCGGAANLYLYVAEDLLSTDPCNGNPGDLVPSSLTSSYSSTSSFASLPVSSTILTTTSSTLSSSSSSYPSSSPSSETSSSVAASTPVYSPPPYSPPPYTTPVYTPPPYTPPPYTTAPASSSSSIPSAPASSSSSIPSAPPSSSSSSETSAPASSSSTPISPPSPSSSSESSASLSSSLTPLSSPYTSPPYSSPASTTFSYSSAPVSSLPSSSAASSTSSSSGPTSPASSSSSIPSSPSPTSSTSGPASPTSSSSTISSTSPPISPSSPPTSTYSPSTLSSAAPTSSSTPVSPQTTTSPSSTSVPSSPSTSSSAKPSTTTSPTIPQSSATLCISTISITPTPSCEYKVGNWCSNPLPPFTDQPSCLTAANTCAIQLTSCLLSAGFPSSLQCLQFSTWCQKISSYCESYCPGLTCSITGCKSKYPPPGYTPPVISTKTFIYACPTTIQTSSKTSPTTSIAPLPTCSNICLQPNNPSKGYGSYSPVGSIPLPCYTCNNLQPEYSSGYPFKLYTAQNSADSPGYSRPDCGQGCQDACEAQYTSCVETYARSCMYGSGEGGDTYQGALGKCEAQKEDCYKVNQGIGGVGRCTSWNSGY